MKLSIARLPEQIEALRPTWERLFTSGSYTRFQSFEWNALAAQMFAHRQAPAIVCAEDDDGAAIIPACIAPDGELSLIGDELFDYRSPLHSGSPAALQAAFETLSGLGDSFTFNAVREPVSPLWPAEALSEFSKAPALLASDKCPPHSRLGRCLRRLFHSGCALTDHSGSETSLIRRIYELKAEQGGNLFTDRLRIEFMCQLAHRDAEAFDIYTLENNADLVAALITFRDGDWRRFYTIYFDERWAKYSPGLALLHEIAQRTIAVGMNCDFLTGEQPYKMRLASTVVPLWTVQLSREQMVHAVARQLEAAA